MFAKTTAMAAREFLRKLPEEVVMLALEAVELQERLDGMTDKQPPLRGCFCYSMIGSVCTSGRSVRFFPSAHAFSFTWIVRLPFGSMEELPMRKS